MRSLSIFVDESGDFGKTDNKNPYYLLTLVLHDQSKPLSLSKLEWLDNRLKGLFSEGSNTYVHAELNNSIRVIITVIIGKSVPCMVFVQRDAILYPVILTIISPIDA